MSFLGTLSAWHFLRRVNFYGGLILATVAIIVWVRRKKIPFLFVADATSPSLAIAYGIGRIGCILPETAIMVPDESSMGTNYQNGTVPPSVMFRGSEIAKNYPNGIVPDNTPLHPAPFMNS